MNRKPPLRHQYLKNMKHFNIIVLGLLALSLTACAEKASVSGVIEGTAKDTIIATRLNINTFSVIDTVVSDANGKFRLSVKVKEGQPEFVYLFRNGKKVASLLLEKGDKVNVVTDTLGNCVVEGSESSVKLLEVEKAFADFAAKMDSSLDNKVISQYYLDYHRWCVKYIISNPYSMTVIPVLYGQLGPYAQVFCHPADAIYFKSACDSLKTRYPESVYVKALENEATRRLNANALRNRIKEAGTVSFPDMELPDINGRKVKLSSLNNKAVILHFWDADDPVQKMFTQETLKPLYKKYHSRGLEIYSVCLSANKVVWADVVRSQGLEWINVNDGKGAQLAVINYNVSSLPASILIENGEICTKSLQGVAALSKELDSIL